MSTQSKGKTGVILMTYGSATSASGVPEYLDRIYKGKASPELIRDFENRYRLVGHSLLIEITNRQASRLQNLLGDTYVVRAGMRHSSPSIQEAVADCRDAGATSLIGIILSPQLAPFITDGYQTLFIEAASRHGFDEKHRAIAKSWETEPHFVQLLTEEVATSLEELHKKYSTSVPIIFTTHSLPKRVVEKDSDYLQQISATIDAVREKLDPNLEWYSGYQSAGHTPEEWLTPDLKDILQHLQEKKFRAVLIVPVQFLADHLEVLYDLDIAASKQCKEYGIAYNRIPLPNTEPLFMETLRSVVKNTEGNLSAQFSG
jgi:protoporphyrin/coproporphyrin ferrochelatase